MDDIVKAAMAKWPNVPDCYGWLGLDSRGNWYMRDERAQAAGPFGAVAGDDAARHAVARGALLRHEKLIDFIQRNYAADERGQWFFQNGPQRVYVELEVAPYVWRIGAGPWFGVHAHSGEPVKVLECLLDEAGKLYLKTSIGLGLVHTQDMGHAADAIEAGRWHPIEVEARDLPRRYGYVLSPQSL